jgi:hypothetical protein
MRTGLPEVGSAMPASSEPADSARWATWGTTATASSRTAALTSRAQLGTAETRGLAAIFPESERSEVF